jgi:lysozyme family protein
MTENNYAACFDLSLAQECPFPKDWGNARNFSDTPGDSGGATMCGVTQREYDVWRKSQGEPTQDVRKITRGEGLVLEHQSYWLPHCGLLPNGLDLQHFDTSLNEGPHAALLVLQDALNVRADGVWGPLTASAVSSANIVALVQRYTLARHAAYARIVASHPGDAKFEKDWFRRCTGIGNAALLMAQNASQGAAIGGVGTTGKPLTGAPQRPVASEQVMAAPPASAPLSPLAELKARLKELLDFL